MEHEGRNKCTKCVISYKFSICCFRIGHHMMYSKWPIQLLVLSFVLFMYFRFVWHYFLCFLWRGTKLTWEVWKWWELHCPTHFIGILAICLREKVGKDILYPIILYTVSFYENRRAPQAPIRVIKIWQRFEQALYKILFQRKAEGFTRFVNFKSISKGWNVICS